MSKLENCHLQYIQMTGNTVKSLLTCPRCSLKAAAPRSLHWPINGAGQFNQVTGTASYHNYFYGHLFIDDHGGLPEWFPPWDRTISITDLSGKLAFEWSTILLLRTVPMLLSEPGVAKIENAEHISVLLVFVIWCQIASLRSQLYHVKMAEWLEHLTPM